MLRDININVRGSSLRLWLEATVLGNLEPIMYTNYFANSRFAFRLGHRPRSLRFYVRCLVNNGVARNAIICMKGSLRDKLTKLR